MSAAAAVIRDARWRHWYLRSLPAYWIFLFCATHIPRLRLDGPVPETDKWAHLIAFALLAFLFWRFREALPRPVSGRFVWIAVVWIAFYAAVDEYLQSYVGRTASLLDWAADLAGAGITLGVLEWRRRAVRGRGASATPLDSPSA
jgi:VanZ family protein